MRTEDIANLIKNNPGIDSKKIREELGINSDQLRDAMKSLTKSGYIFSKSTSFRMTKEPQNKRRNFVKEVGDILTACDGDYFRADELSDLLDTFPRNIYSALGKLVKRGVIKKVQVTQGQGGYSMWGCDNG